MESSNDEQKSPVKRTLKPSQKSRVASEKSSYDGCGEEGGCCGYKKRRLNCCGKRRYKAKVSGRACVGKYNHHKINLCNRNWTRISVNPFINFLRKYRRRFSSCTPIETIAMKAECAWKKLSERAKACYYEQAKRARCRGFRT